MLLSSWSQIPRGPWTVVRCLIAALVMYVVMALAIPSTLMTTLLSFTSAGSSGAVSALGEKSLSLLLVLALAALILRPMSASVVGLMLDGRVLVVAAAGAVLLNLIVEVWTRAAGVTNNTDALVRDFGLGKGVGADLMLVAAIAWLGPVFEEFLFRGFLYRPVRDAAWRFGRTLAVGIAAVLSAAAFASIHLDPNQTSLLPMYLVYGLITVAAYEITGSLMAPAILHATSNAYALWKAAGADLTWAGNVAIAITPLAAIALVWISGRVLDLSDR